jgi:hypothetical protein
MKIGNLNFTILLSFSLYTVVWSFRYSYLCRGYFSLGGEIFTLLFPVFIIVWRNCTLNEIKKRKEVK